MVPTGANFPALFTLQGALYMKRTIAKFAKTLGTPVPLAAALTLLPAGAHADLVFEHGGHTYQLVTSPTTWHQASAAAEALTLGGNTGYLARIDSASENEAILTAVSTHLSPEQFAETIPDDGSEAAFVWLGGSDQDSEGQWVWTNNGDPFWQGDFNGAAVGGRYANWGVQPDNAGGAEDALAMGLADWPEPFYDLGDTGQWNDLNAENPLFYLVEFDGQSDLALGVEEPGNGKTYAGIGMVRGWAVSSDMITRVAVSIDGKHAFDLPHGGPHGSAANRFPNIPGSDKAGYSTPLNFSAMEAGEHTLTVTVTDGFGTSRSRTITFETARFEKSFVPPSDVVELGWSIIRGLGDQMYVYDAVVDGSSYNITMQWDTVSQSFKINRIEAK